MASQGIRVLTYILAALLVVELIVAFTWRIGHDTAILHYAALLIDRHSYVPYRDVLDTSLGGTFLFHILVGKLFGYSDLAFRFVDTALLLLLLGVTGLSMRRLGSSVAILAALMFGLLYLSKGPTMSLQRDYIAIMPVALSLLIAAYPSKVDLRAKSLAIGALFAISALIKPHLLVGLPVILAYMSFEFTAESRQQVVKPLVQIVKCAVYAGIGFLAIVGLSLLWLWQAGAMPSFLDMFFRYLPLHVELNSEHEVLASGERPVYLIKEWVRYVAKFAPFILLGLYVAWVHMRLDSGQRRLVVTLAALAAAYSIEPVFAGQFFSYHWMPFNYFAVLCIALTAGVLYGTVSNVQLRPAIVLAALLLFNGTLAVESFTIIRDLMQDKGVESARLDRADDIADFLEAADLAPDDRVLPLDWTAGTVHAMLIADVQPATRFIYDAFFYHHISNPYIQELRQELISDLTAEPPRFVIEVDLETQPRPSGPDTSLEFPELRSFLAANYHLAHAGDGFTILERND